MFLAGEVIFGIAENAENAEKGCCQAESAHLDLAWNTDYYWK